MGIENFSSEWMPADKELTPYYQGIDEFVSQNLLPHSKFKEKELRDIGSKSISDPLLGYIHLEPWEMDLIETRLFQRLRKIRQVGLAYLVYPTLGYSRFEHSIGVLGRINQLITRLIQYYSIPAYKKPEFLGVIDDHIVSIRIAALFHDIGHCLFSHVTERVMRELSESRHDDYTYPSSSYIINKISASLGLKKDLAPAEVLSLSIISSNAFRKYFERLDIPDASDEKRERWLKNAAHFSVGLSIPDNPTTVFLAQLMSSGLDADKIDYMLREAYFANIPLSIDLIRIIDKLRIHKLDPSQLPLGLSYLKEKGTDFLGDENRFFVLGLSHGGQFAFEEFCLARTSLYDKIYLHQKVRAAEAQAYTVLKRIPELASEYNEFHNWLYLKESMLEYGELILPRQREADLFYKKSYKVPVKELNAETLNDKLLLKRAYAMGLRNSLSESSVSIQSSQAISFLEAIKRDHSKFRDEVISEIKNIYNILEENIPDQSLLDSIVVDPCDANRVQQGATTIYIKQPVTLTQRWSLPIDQVASYYTQSRALTYVFAPNEICPIVNLAVEKVAWTFYHLQFEQHEFVRDSIIKQAELKKRILMKKQYYKDSLALKVKSSYLLSPEAQEKIWKVVENLSNFSSFKKDKVTQAKVATFLMQFDESLQKDVLQLIENIEVFDISKIGDLLVNSVNELKKLGYAHVLISPLGNFGDSAAHIAYEFKNHEVEAIAELPSLIQPLNDIALIQSDSLVIYDDNINSATQLLNIFSEWLECELPKEYKLNEAHVSKLSDDAKNKLKSIPITFVFGVAPSEIQTKLKHLLTTIFGINENNVSVHLCKPLHDDDKPLTGGSARINFDRKEELTRELRKIATDLMVKEGKKKEVAESRALGDNGAEALIAFPYNVPTMTITALWCGGEYNSQEWVPLIPRRRNKKGSKFVGYDA